MAETTNYAVSGMTCGHCVATVTSSLTAIGGVNNVAVELVADGDSTVTVVSEQPLDRHAVRSAISGAGFTLVS